MARSKHSIMYHILYTFYLTHLNIFYIFSKVIESNKKHFKSRKHSQVTLSMFLSCNKIVVTVKGCVSSYITKIAALSIF